MDMLMAFILIGVMGLVFGGLLAIAANYFSVEEDVRVEAVNDLLPGANCGACGFAGCYSYAENIVAGGVEVSCAPGGKEVAESIYAVMGIDSVAAKAKKVAEVYCLGSRDVAPDKFEYHGIRSCKAAMAYSGGFKACSYGCLGMGDCADSCPFGAMHMGSEGLPVVDVDRCTGCGICARTCPKNIIRTVDVNRIGKYVPCNSRDKGKIVRSVCEVGCTGCGACAKVCPRDAIVVQDNLAVIDGSKCDNCGKCVEACKRMIIRDVAKVSRISRVS